MTFEEIDLSEVPQSYKFSKLLDQQFYLWERYTPTTVEKDIPFEQDWWKYVYWIPKIKKEFYIAALTAGNMELGIQAVANKYGMDYWFFTTHYKEFFKRLEWMRKQGVTEIGESKV